MVRTTKKVKESKPVKSLFLLFVEKQEVRSQMRETKMRITGIPTRKYLELEKYFPMGSKGAIVEH